jgi:hypothetical protein
MSGPQVYYRLAVDGDRHRRTNLALPREVLGKGLAHPPEARIAYAADSNISGSFAHHSSPLDALGKRYRRERANRPVRVSESDGRMTLRDLAANHFSDCHLAVSPPFAATAAPPPDTA